MAPHFFDNLGAHKQEGGAFIARTIKEMEVNCIIHLSPAKNCYHNPERHVKRTTKLTKQQPSNSLGKDPHSWVSLMKDNSELIQLSERKVQSQKQRLTKSDFTVWWKQDCDRD